MRAFIVSLGMKAWASISDEWEYPVGDDKKIKEK